MTTTELKEQYTTLYDYMAQSRDPKNMKVFGCVMTEMMDAMLQKMPTEAEEMIQKLEAIRWKNYLTTKEADRIIANMEPKARGLAMNGVRRWNSMTTHWSINQSTTVVPSMW